MQTFRSRRAVATVLLALYLPACTHWVEPQGITPQEYVATKHPNRVRLTVNNITHGLHQLELLAPSVGPGDSLTGFPGGASPLVTVALSAIERLEVHESNPSGTTGAVLGGAAVAGLVALAIVAVIAASLSPCPAGWGCQ